MTKPDAPQPTDEIAGDPRLLTPEVEALIRRAKAAWGSWDARQREAHRRELRAALDADLLRWHQERGTHHA